MAEPLDSSSQPAPGTTNPSRPFVVGLGASAGGIAALQSFFSRVEPHTGAAYAVVLHLSPDHDSRLAEVLQVTSAMPVTQVKGNTPIVPDHVYVVPPNKSLGIVDGTLTVTPFTKPEDRVSPVDKFFRMLADTHGSRSACVILSGTGTDGSSGLKRVKEYGGLVVAQDPAEAEYADMPRNAIATALVDLVLPIAEMPGRIRAYIEGLSHEDEAAAAPAAFSENAEAIRDILTVLRLRTGHDFANYKQPTLRRRIERRMMLRTMPTVESYARLVRQEPDETVSLMKELLISVTNFFRDPHAWKALEERVVPRIFANKSSDDQVRVWVPGCATGEEAYSVGILLCEHAAAIKGNPPAIQLFASDLDQSAIERARRAVYSEAEVADVPPERLQRFFQKHPGGYEIRRDLRELVLFATHNVIKDPPFSHLDLICCRNLLIYLNRAIQERVMETFHFALRPGRYLFLGTSESADGGPNDLFLRFDADAHIYESRTVTSRTIPPPLETPATASGRQQAASPEARAAERILPADLHQRLLEQYAPPSVIVNEEHNIVHMSEQAGRYLQIRGGEPTRDVLMLVRPELRADLRSALHQAKRDRTMIDIHGLQVSLDGGVRQVDVRVRPVLREGDPLRGFFVVLFDERPGSSAESATALAPGGDGGPAALELEDELTRVKAQLRLTVEQYETQVEEAKASNEELQAMNEELRSAAEELETSKEELQWVNEELTTVNQELTTKIEELGLTNNDFHNFVNATDIGTIFLDRSLRVKFFTPRSRDLFNLQDSDLARPLSDITNHIRHPEIHDDVRAVLDRLSNIEREVQSHDGRWHLMRMLPYRTSDDRIGGVVITFQDIAERHSAEVRLRESEERLRLLIDGALEYAIFTMTEQGVINSWNPGAQRMFGYPADDIVGSDFGILFTPEDRTHGAPAHELEEAARTGRALDERYHVRSDGSLIYCSGVTRRLGPGGIGFAKIARDLSAQREAAVALQRANDGLERRVDERTADLATEVRAHDAAKGEMSQLLHQLVTSQEDERRRIAHDLHDDLGQRLTALRLALERARQAGSRDVVAAEHDRALRLVEELGVQVDFLAWQLRPAVLDELGLAAALPRYVKEWSAHTGIPAEFRLGGYGRGQLPPDAEVVYYRVAQEALNNVAKHAHATRVDVVLGASDTGVVLVVEDDGIGFGAAARDEGPSGFGLIGMRERAAIVGATLHIESATGHGTAIYLRRPVPTPSGGETAS